MQWNCCLFRSPLSKIMMEHFSKNVHSFQPLTIFAISSTLLYTACLHFTKCPNTELFLVSIQSEYRKIRTRNDSIFGHFSHSVRCLTGFCIGLWGWIPIRIILPLTKQICNISDKIFPLQRNHDVMIFTYVFWRKFF